MQNRFKGVISLCCKMFVCSLFTCVLYICLYFICVIRWTCMNEWMNKWINNLHSLCLTLYDSQNKKLPDRLKKYRTTREVLYNCDIDLRKPHPSPLRLLVKFKSLIPFSRVRLSLFSLPSFSKSLSISHFTSLYSSLSLSLPTVTSWNMVRIRVVVICKPFRKKYPNKYNHHKINVDFF